MFIIALKLEHENPKCQNYKVDVHIVIFQGLRRKSAKLGGSIKAGEDGTPPTNFNGNSLYVGIYTLIYSNNKPAIQNTKVISSASGKARF